MPLACIRGSTSEGILAVDTQGPVVRTNRGCAELWRIPQALLDSRDDQALLAHVTGQLVDPDEFRRKVDALYQSNAESADLVLFRDGRSFDRFTTPLLLAGVSGGRHRARLQQHPRGHPRQCRSGDGRSD